AWPHREFGCDPFPSSFQPKQRRTFLSEARRASLFQVQFGKRRRRLSVSRRLLFSFARTLLRLAPLQILPEQGDKTFPPFVLLRAPGVVRAHVIPLASVRRTSA